MGAKRRPATNPQGGRPSKLMQPEVADNLVKAIELGVPIYIACQGVGISDQTFRNWLHRGQLEQENRDAGHDPDDAEDPYFQLYRQVIEARVKAATRNVAVIQKAAQGGTIIEETTRTITTPNGDVVEEKTVKRQAPDWRAASWYLERSHRGEFGRDATQVEITTSATSAAALAEQERPPTLEEELAARLARHLSEGAITLALPGGSSEPEDDDIVDAEVVESGDEATVPAGS